MTKKKCVVYIFKCGNFYKIGWAVDYLKRYKELQTGNPFKLERIVVIDCDSSKYAQKLEAKLHKKYADKRYRGEWFKFLPAEAEKYFAIGKDALA